ncbi:IOLX-like protein [Mya arenaria]|uniref:IOLX-like protein n=1 Tax=Mya arenaria TaxID=6604 RepID=A0ABY7G576_MYAAR|nr:IOLX-like protein [Mya arenaria]
MPMNKHVQWFHFRKLGGGRGCVVSEVTVIEKGAGFVVGDTTVGPGFGSGEAGVLDSDPATLGRRTYASQGVHLKNILSNRRLDLKWIVDNNKRRIQEVKGEFYLDGNTPFFPSSEKDRLLSDKSLDAVVVVSPTSRHTEYIVQSLKHGKDVFTEKPAGESVSDIRLCYEMAESTGRTFLTGFTRRFDDLYRDVKSAIDNGTLGKLQVIKTTTRDSPKPSYEFLKSADTNLSQTRSILL